MTSKLDLFSAALADMSIEHALLADRITVVLPAEFGDLELRALSDGDDSIEIVDANFHTHSSVLAAEYGATPEEAFARLVSDILASRLLLVEEFDSSGNTRKTVEESLDQYLEYLPEGSSYRVANEI